MPAFVLALALSLIAAIGAAAAEPIGIVAAENFYADVAAQIGGAEATVTSILNNPNQDPHLFEVSPSVARKVSAAQIVIYNGLDYDPWMPKLLATGHAEARQTIVAADLVGKKPGENPHLWYDPDTMPRLAARLTETLAAADPADAALFHQRLSKFTAAMAPLRGKVAELRQRVAGMPVTATEPVFGYMFAALGMQVRNGAFQLAVMNDTEPSAADIAGFQSDLRSRRVKLLVYNSQTASPIAARMRQLAEETGIPVLGVSETEPEGKNYQAWMADVLAALDRALPRP